MHLYEVIVKMDIAEILDEEVWLNKSGDVVANEEEALGNENKNHLEAFPKTHILFLKSEVTPVKKKWKEGGGVRKCYVLEQLQGHNNKVQRRMRILQSWDLQLPKEPQWCVI